MTNPLALSRVVEHFRAEPKGKDYIGTCPFCQHHSLSISSGDKQPVVAHCFQDKCNHQDELTKLVLDVANSDTPVLCTYVAPRRVKRSHSEEELWARLHAAEATLMADEQAVDFLFARGITAHTAKSFRLGVCSQPFPDCPGKYLVIPYLDGTFGETVLSLKFRQLQVPRNPDMTENKSKKWRHLKVTTGTYRLFNVPLLRTGCVGPLVICESELDAMMLHSMGIDSCSVDSAAHKLTEEDKTLLLGAPRIFLAPDQDEEGLACGERLMLGLPGSRFIGGYGDCAKDLGELRNIRAREGKNLKDMLHQLFDEAKQEAEAEPTFTDAGNGQRFVRHSIAVVRHCKQRDRMVGSFGTGNVGDLTRWAWRWSMLG